MRKRCLTSRCRVKGLGFRDEEEVFDIQVSLCDGAMSWSDVMSLCDVTMSWCVAMVCRNGVLQVTGTTFSLNKVQKDKDTGVARRV